MSLTAIISGRPQGIRLRCHAGAALHRNIMFKSGMATLVRVLSSTSLPFSSSLMNGLTPGAPFKRPSFGRLSGDFPTTNHYPLLITRKRDPRPIQALPNPFTLPSKKVGELLSQEASAVQFPLLTRSFDLFVFVSSAIPLPA